MAVTSHYTDSAADAKARNAAPHQPRTAVIAMAEAIVREVYGDTPPPAPAIPLRGAGA